MTPYLLAFFIAESVTGWTLAVARGRNNGRKERRLLTVENDLREAAREFSRKDVRIIQMASRIALLKRENEEQAEKLSRVASFKECPSNGLRPFRDADAMAVMLAQLDAEPAQTAQTEGRQ